MPTHRRTFSSRFLSFAGLLAASSILAQQDPVFTAIQPLTNREMRLLFSAPTGTSYRIQVATNLEQWNSLLTLTSAGINPNTDSAAPFLGGRFYRAVEVTGSNVFTGDHLVTDDGEVIIHPINHASFVMSWNGKTLYNDPVGGAAPYQGLPRADLVLVSHIHSDHYLASTLAAVRGTNGVIIAPLAVYNDAGMAALRGSTVVLTNNTSTNLAGIGIEAVPAYNSNHPRGTGNGYVLTIGRRQIYMSGDTGDIPEMQVLPNIDVAFVCMNVPYTMSVTQAAAVIRAFHPKVVYPYHYRNQDSTYANFATLKQLVGTDLGIEVRLRKWY
jgi:L-ascorbate metabolism protein UlaG (beta-lactamase superfamily)